MISCSYFTKSEVLYITNLFHRCLSVLEDLPTANDDQKKGISIVQFALKQPTMKIAENAGAGTYLLDRQFIINGALAFYFYSLYLLPLINFLSDASVVVNKVLEAEDVNWGYDAMVGSYVNMIEAGIIDPTKVSLKACGM